MVHPMPMEERTGSRDDVSKREKPAVPAKPKGLRVDHMNRSISMASLSSPVSSSPSTFLNSSFVASPSLISLQKSYQNPDMGSQEMQRLDDRRYESISAVSRRISGFEEERVSTDRESADNERLGQAILELVERHEPELASKIRQHLWSKRELWTLESKLTYQMDVLVERSATSGDAFSQEHSASETFLRRRMGDCMLLRNVYRRRDQDIDSQMSQLLTDGDFRMWQTYLDRAAKLTSDSTQASDRLHDHRIHLRALHNVRSPLN